MSFISCLQVTHFCTILIAPLSSCTVKVNGDISRHFEVIVSDISLSNRFNPFYKIAFSFIIRFSCDILLYEITKISPISILNHTSHSVSHELHIIFISQILSTISNLFLKPLFVVCKIHNVVMLIDFLNCLWTFQSASKH